MRSLLRRNLKLSADYSSPSSESREESEKPPRVVVVGAGIAGMAAVESLRAASPSAEITLISLETELPYYRLNLTRYLAGEVNRESLPIHPAAWYDGAERPAHARRRGLADSTWKAMPSTCRDGKRLAVRQAPSGRRCQSLHPAHSRFGPRGRNQPADGRGCGLPAEGVRSRGSLRLHRRRDPRPGDCRGAGPPRGQGDARWKATGGSCRDS